MPVVYRQNSETKRYSLVAMIVLPIVAIKKKGIQGELVVRIISWNVNGIRAVYKKNLTPFVKKANADILCLQETKAHRDQVEEEAKTLGYPHAYWSSALKKGYSGVATFCKNEPLSIQTGINIPDYETEGRFVITEFPLFLVYNIYFPNGGARPERHNFKQEFLASLLSHLAWQLNLGKEIIVVGDYNIAHTALDIYDPVRLAKESGFLPEERAWMDSFFKLGFIDTFRYFNKDSPSRYSWWSYREFAKSSNRGWRIDYISVSRGLEKYLEKADIWDRVDGSDHSPVVLDLNIP
jgi:exodeoxyribonuclease-3